MLDHMAMRQFHETNPSRSAMTTFTAGIKTIDAIAQSLNLKVVTPPTIKVRESRRYMEDPYFITLLYQKVKPQLLEQIRVANGYDLPGKSNRQRWFTHCAYRITGQ